MCQPLKPNSFGDREQKSEDFGLKPFVLSKCLPKANKLSQFLQSRLLAFPGNRQNPMLTNVGFIDFNTNTTGLTTDLWEDFGSPSLSVNSELCGKLGDDGVR
jgi:hypothetical protein